MPAEMEYTVDHTNSIPKFIGITLGSFLFIVAMIMLFRIFSNKRIECIEYDISDELNLKRLRDYEDKEDDDKKYY